MSRCPGASQPRAGIPEALVFTAENIGPFLPAPLQALTPFLPYIKPIVIDSATNFCASDPPGLLSVPGLDSWLALKGGVRGSLYSLAVDFLTNLALNYLWDHMCECASGTQTYTVAPTLPTLPVADPPSLVRPTGDGACLTATSAEQNNSTATTSRRFVIGYDQNAPYYSGGVIPGPAIAVPAGATTFRWSLQLDTPPSGYSSNVWDTYIIWRTFDNTFINTRPNDVFTSPHAPLAKTTKQDVIPSGATQFSVYYAPYPQPAVQGYLPHVVVELFCDGGYGTYTSQPCCPPDSTLIGFLSRIEDLLTLVQRQAAPFAYVPGAQHTGLTGAGHINLAAVLGVKVDLTTVPGYTGLQAGDPDTIFEAGWVNFGGSDGYSARTVLHTTPQLIFPNLAGQYTRLGYTLNPGVVATVTELVREP